MEKETEVLELEKSYSTTRAVSVLRRLADALEQGEAFRVQIDGHRVRVPTDATIEIEYSDDGDERELEFEIKWRGTE